MANRVVPVLVVSLCVAVLLAACGGDDTAGEEIACGADAVDTAGVAELADGVLTIGSHVAYPPIDFYDVAGVPSGLDIDLADALARHLCVTVEIVDTPFEQLIGDLNAYDLDVIMSAMTITEERAQSANFTPYASVGASIVVRAGNTVGILATDDLCGLTVAVQSGTIHEDFVRDLSATCQPAPGGRGPIDILTFDDSGDAVRDVVTGASEATLTDFPAAFVYAEEDARLELVDIQICPQPYGIATRTGSTRLQTAIAEALLGVNSSGAYDATMKKWNLSEARLELPQVLAGGSHDLVGGCDAVGHPPTAAGG